MAALSLEPRQHARCDIQWCRALLDSTSDQAAPPEAPSTPLPGDVTDQTCHFEILFLLFVSAIAIRPKDLPGLRVGLLEW